MRIVFAFLLLLSCGSLQAQPAPGVHRVGVLIPVPSPDRDAFPQAMKDLGYSEGANLVLDVRIAGDKPERLPALAAELVRLSPQVIVAANTPGAAAAMAATTSIPIVMVAVGDPVGSGFTSSLARPDKNATGVSNMCGALAGKRLALLKETLPQARRIAVMLNPGDPITLPQIADAEKTAPSLGLEVRMFPVRTNDEVDAAFKPMLKWRVDGILWLCGQQVLLTRRTLANAARHRLPTMVVLSTEVPGGGLISYAANNPDIYRRAAFYVDRILKGAKISDLPVEQPTKLELVVNQKTAKSLGVAIPPSILLRADRVIE